VTITARAEAAAHARAVKASRPSRVSDTRTVPDIGLDCEALYRALDVRRREKRISFRQIMREAGLRPATTTRLGHGEPPNADSLIRLLAWLGTTDLGPYIRKSPNSGSTA
jgi:hypothetical protein